ncbi:hypothetical protein OJ967_12215 [Peribacillus frigoritolerans]|nr:hypothetical protein [Peribacillus frigoritolerans]UYZ01187.1 hypothetical protein OJ967_12215 [Peribacillus frigoritolerans]
MKSIKFLIASALVIGLISISVGVSPKTDSGKITTAKLDPGGGRP